MSVLQVLMPLLSRTHDDLAFHHWLARGDRLPNVQNARVTVLREQFRFSGDSIPAAALRHHCHAGDAAGANWLCADPAYVRTEATGARLMACPVEVTVIEADEFAKTLRPLFTDAGMPLAIDTPYEWCVHLTGDIPRASFVHPAEALGVDLIECLPGGDAGRKWRRLFNEVQILLHAHPLNAARIAAGRIPVNALWFWGGGTLPDSVETGLRCVASADGVLRGLAKMGVAVRVEPSWEALEAAGGEGDALLDLERPGELESIAEWLATFERWLRERRFETIVLVFAGGERYRMRHAHRLRFWVRRRDLSRP